MINSQYRIAETELLIADERRIINTAGCSNLKNWTYGKKPLILQTLSTRKPNHFRLMSDSGSRIRCGVQLFLFPRTLLKAVHGFPTRISRDLSKSLLDHCSK